MSGNFWKLETVGFLMAEREHRAALAADGGAPKAKRRQA
jgi:hypothetical protein